MCFFAEEDVTVVVVFLGDVGSLEAVLQGFIISATRPFFASDFLKSEYFPGVGGMPYTITYDNDEVIPNKLWESGDWKKSVFGVKIISKFNVNAFLFQLVASGILTFEWSNANRTLMCLLGTDKNNKYTYALHKYWKGFTFRSKEWGRKAITYSELFKKY